MNHNNVVTLEDLSLTVLPCVESTDDGRRHIARTCQGEAVSDTVANGATLGGEEIFTTFTNALSSILPSTIVSVAASVAEAV